MTTNWTAIDQVLNQYIGSVVVDPAANVRQLQSFEWTDRGELRLLWNNDWFSEFKPDEFASQWTLFQPIGNQHAAVSLPAMFETGHVDEQLSPDTLDLAQALIAQTLKAINKRRLVEGVKVAEKQYKKCLHLQEQIQVIQRKKRAFA